MRAFLTAAAMALLTTGTAHAALVVSKGSTVNVACDANAVCQSIGENAVLNVKQLRRMLVKHDVTLVSGGDAKDIVVGDEITWAASHRLTFNSWRSIVFTFAVTSQGTGGVTLITNAGNIGGDYLFTGKGKLAFWDTSTSLIINGETYTLVDSVGALTTAATSDPSGHFALSRFADASQEGTLTDPIFSFGGTFTGLGHTIDRLTLNPDLPTTGFFRIITAGGVVRDLIFTNATMRGDNGPDWGIAAGENDGTMQRVSVNGSVRTKGGAALLAGLNNGTIVSCTTSGTVYVGGAETQAAGLVRQNFGSIVDSHTSASVNGSWIIGGFVADNRGPISRSSATGSVTMRSGGKFGLTSGGFIGVNTGTIDRSFSTGAVDGGHGLKKPHHGHTLAVSGGFIGRQEDGSVTNSYAHGAVAIGDLGHAGGLVGLGQGPFTYSYATGLVTAPTAKQGAGFIWETGQAATHDYWDFDTTGQAKGCHVNADCGGVTGLPTGTLTSELPSGFDPSVWGSNASIDGGYPYLLDNPPG